MQHHVKVKCFYGTLLIQLRFSFVFIWLLDYMSISHDASGYVASYVVANSNIISNHDAKFQPCPINFLG